MSKLTVKDFKYFNKDLEIVSCDFKKLTVYVVLEDNRVIYRVSRPDSNVILHTNTFEEALEEYNKISERLDYPFK